MMNKLLIVLLSASILSCGGAGEESKENENEKTDSLVISMEEEMLDLEIADFLYFEDYAEVKTKVQLYDIFGEENLVDDTAWFAEGEVMMLCTDLRNPDSDHMIRYVWSDECLDTMSFIEAQFQNYDKDYQDLGTQELQAENGLYIGMPLDELVEWNEGDFSFAGFGWDYEGGITAEEGSKIMKSPVMISLSMDTMDGLDEKYQILFGDRMVSSADPKVEGAPIIVNYMSISNLGY